MSYRKQMLKARGPHGERYARIRAERTAAVEAGVTFLLDEGCQRLLEFPAYIVSPSGDVYSTVGTRLLKVKPGKKRSGYLFVGLKGKDGPKYRMVHRLVAEAFIPNPRHLPTVNHIDGVKENNAVANLEWASYAENITHALRTGLIRRGPDRPRSKLTAEQVREIRDSKDSCKVAGKRHGVCAQVICNVRNRKSYASVA